MATVSFQICEDLIALMDRLKISMLTLAERQGLTRVQAIALHAIYRHGELPMGGVAGLLHCDASNVTGLVDRLVVQGLVVRKECATDRRSKTLQLTEKGRDVIETLRAALPAELGCDRLSSHERETLHSIVKKLEA